MNKALVPLNAADAPHPYTLPSSVEILARLADMQRGAYYLWDLRMSFHIWQHVSPFKLVVEQTQDETLGLRKKRSRKVNIIPLYHSMKHPGVFIVEREEISWKIIEDHTTTRRNERQRGLSPQAPVRRHHLKV